MSLSVDIPANMRNKLEEKKEKEYYSSMSELVREALRNYLKQEELEDLTKKEKAVYQAIKEGQVENVKLEGEAKRKIREGLYQLES